MPLFLRDALSLLRSWFSSKSPSVRAVTVRGKLLSAMDYTTVERMGGATVSIPFIKQLGQTCSLLC